MFFLLNILFHFEIHDNKEVNELKTLFNVTSSIIPGLKQDQIIEFTAWCWLPQKKAHWK